VTGEQNILDARFLVVNRLASKCIQRLGLNGIDLVERATTLTNLLPAATVFTRRCLKSGRNGGDSFMKDRIF
jgi:hypothetical protein